jgi:hypothetical protein
MPRSLSFLFLLLHREVHSAQQVLEARVGTQGIVEGQAKVLHAGIVLLEGFLEPVYGQFVFTRINISKSDTMCVENPLAWLPVPCCQNVSDSSLGSMVAALFEAPFEGLQAFRIESDSPSLYGQLFLVHPLLYVSILQRVLGEQMEMVS